MNNRPHYVYRAFDSYGLLLYVGCSSNTTARLNTHRTQAPWYRFAETFGITGPWSRDEAYARERAAIDSEGPYFNSSFADMVRTQANKHAATKALRDRGHCPPVLDLNDNFDEPSIEEATAYEVEAAAWERAHKVESLRLKAGRYPFMTDADRRDRYMAARADAELARLEDVAA